MAEAVMPWESAPTRALARRVAARVDWLREETERRRADWRLREAALEARRQALRAAQQAAAAAADGSDDDALAAERAALAAAAEELATLRRRMRSLHTEFTRLSSWQTVAQFHLGAALGAAGDDMISAFQAFLQVRTPTIEHSLQGDEERECLIDRESGDCFMFEHLLCENGSPEERRSVWVCERLDAAAMQQARASNAAAAAAATAAAAAAAAAPGNPAAGMPPAQPPPAPHPRDVVKCLNKSQSRIQGDPLFYRREFIAQTIAGSFSHPNILPLTRYFESQRMVYSALPYVELCLFDQLAAQQQRFGRGFDEAVVKRVFSQMYTAVCFLANIGLVHRDLSLENFVVSRSGRVQLIDFGLCASLQLQSPDCGVWAQQPRAMVGKLFYMAPEVFSGTESDMVDYVAADVWSLGVCLFALISGVLPFDVAGCQCPNFNVVRTRRHGAKHLLISFVKKRRIADLFISDDLLDLLDRLLQVDPDQRISLTDIRMHRFMLM